MTTNAFKKFLKNRTVIFLGMFACIIAIVWIMMNKPSSQERDELVEAEKALITATRQRALAEMTQQVVDKVGTYTFPNGMVTMFTKGKTGVRIS